MRRAGVIFGGLVAVAVMLSASHATAASYGTVTATYLNDSPTRTGQISIVPSGYTALPTAGATDFYIGRSNFSVAAGTDPGIKGLLKVDSNNHFSGYCIDIHQVISPNTYTWDIYDLWDAPVGASPAMGSTKAGILQNLFNTYATGVANDPDQAAAFAASVWEIVNETSSTPLSVSDGAFYVNSTSGNWVTTANAMLTAVAAMPLPTDITVKALVSTDTQDFAFLSGVGGLPPPRTPVPEPLTMFGAFLGISSLGMYIRRRTRATAV